MNKKDKLVSSDDSRTNSDAPQIDIGMGQFICFLTEMADTGNAALIHVTHAEGMPGQIDIHKTLIAPNSEGFRHGSEALLDHCNNEATIRLPGVAEPLATD